MKIDISKAFDTLSWSFLLKVLKAFAFNDKFCQRNTTILNSATISVSINGVQKGYFSCQSGVRQGNPLSPLLFYLAKDVLNKGISHLVANNHIKLIKVTRTDVVPYHVLYAYDIMVFWRGDVNSIDAIRNLFIRYANLSGQQINPAKFIVYASFMSLQRHLNTAYSLGFIVGTFPFIYLGVPMFKGKPKPIHFQFIVDRVIMKLDAWKACLLLIAGRLQLVNLSYTVCCYTTCSYTLGLLM